MGLEDRDYFRTDEYGGQTRFRLQSVVGMLIVVNIVIWLFQVVFLRIDTFSPSDWFACRSTDVFEKFYIWQLFTANFLHDPANILHIAFNMLLLYVFGRELEYLFGPQRFLTVYLLSGMIGMLAETGIAYFVTGRPTDVVGASGCVFGLLTLFSCIFPNREILFLFFLRMKIWHLAAALIAFQVLLGLSVVAGVGTNGADHGVAYWAHLGGAAFGGFYYYRGVQVSQRPERIPRRGFLGSLLDRLRRSYSNPNRGRTGGAKIVDFPDAKRDVEEESHIKVISERIDKLLDKIHREGRESLSQEELDFLRDNSQVYRSRR